METYKKIYIILRHDLTPDGALNTVALLSTGLTKIEPDLVGPPVTDAEGGMHQGISRLPIIIMKGKSVSKIAEIYETLRNEGLPVVPFFEHSRRLRTFEEYELSMKETPIEKLIISGFSTIGDARKLKPFLKYFSLWK